VARKPTFAEKPHRVWVSEANIGFRRSIEAAGTVASPLLAGFSFTLLVLLLPSLGSSKTTVYGERGLRIATEEQHFSAAPEIAAILFLLAGLLLVASIQTAITVRYHAQTPTNYAEWFPQYFREGEHGDDPPADLKGWSWEGVEPARVGDKWIGGWARKHLHEQLVLANWWASLTRWIYHLGILALLSGLALLVLPPNDQATLGRWLLFGIASAGALGEAAWICAVKSERPSKSEPKAGTDPPAASEASKDGDSAAAELVE
jgi:hypothetical protein